MAHGQKDNQLTANGQNMRNIKLTIAYDGTGYKGWQIQKNGLAIQEEVEKAIYAVFKKNCRVNGASRTDAGVHAKAQIANFKINNAVPSEKIPQALNSFLPGSLAVTRAEDVSPDFHPRFSARSKHYRYSILNVRSRDPFAERYAWRVPYGLNVSLMKKEARVLSGRHDFKAFQARDKRERPSVRRITKISIRKKASSVVIDIEGDGFLYNMVRNITGTLVEIGRGYFPPGSMRQILTARDRTKAGPTAPAHGLCLMEVRY